jgi:hypothetical protein
MQNSSSSPLEIPSNFRSVIIDFTTDLSTTFPEYSFLWAKWINPALPEFQIRYLFEYCLSIFPERFFDFLYQNEEIFLPNSEVNTFFLPDVDFKLLFNCDNISEHTKKSLWKYLQLLLFTIVGSTKDKANFGETMNLFDGVDETVLQEKMNETMESIVDFFNNIEKKQSASAREENLEEPKDASSSQPEIPDFAKMFGGAAGGEGLPNMENLNEHLKKLFNGKIGSLAKEMAEEISGEFADLLGDVKGEIHDTKDVIKQLMKNPKKIMDLMKTVASKLDTKMKSGEISRDEIMKEAGDLFGSMKDMGDNKQFMEMFKNLSKMGGIPGMDMKNMKMDMNALNRMTKQQSTRERLRKKMEEKKRNIQTPIPPTSYSLNTTSAPNNMVFRLDGEDAQPKTFIHPDILKEMENTPESKPKVNDSKKKAKKKK